VRLQEGSGRTRQGHGILILRKLDQLTKEGLEGGRFRRLEAAMLARETAHGIWIGYGMGFGEGFSTTSTGLTAGTYEGLCKSALTHAREWLSEGTK
jgi:hypothetical protein